MNDTTEQTGSSLSVSGGTPSTAGETPALPKAKIDYADWITPERAEQTEKDWLANPGIHDAQAEFVTRKHGPHASRAPVKWVVEVGCGSGELARRIEPIIHGYIGMDKNPHFLSMARRKVPHVTFRRFDVQLDTLEKDRTFDMDCVVAFSFLKHFKLAEWDSILARLSVMAGHMIFDIPIAPEDREDDIAEFPHVWLARDSLEKRLAVLGRRILEEKKMNEFETAFYISKPAEAPSGSRRVRRSETPLRNLPIAPI